MNAKLSTLAALAIILTATAACSDPEPTVDLAPTAVAPVAEKVDVGVQTERFAADAGTVGAAIIKPASVAPKAIEVAPEPVAPPDEPSPSLDVVRSAVATGVDNRKPTGVASTFEADGSRVWAWVEVENRDEPSEIQMVWKRDGKTVQTSNLRVGVSPGWRTWSYKTLRKWDAGSWTVEVVSADGDLLETLEFEVAASPAS